jgi:hypothetical protein
MLTGRPLLKLIRTLLLFIASILLSLVPAVVLPITLGALSLLSFSIRGEAGGLGLFPHTLDQAILWILFWLSISPALVIGYVVSAIVGGYDPYSNAEFIQGIAIGGQILFWFIPAANAVFGGYFAFKSLRR